MQIQPAVKKETARIAWGTGVGCGIMLLAFWLLNLAVPHRVPFDYRVVLSGCLGSILAVSYTHLDVYKRQHIGFREMYHNFGDKLTMLPAPDAQNQAYAKAVIMWRNENENKLRRFIQFLKNLDN